MASAISTVPVPSNGRGGRWKRISCTACGFYWEVPAGLSSISRGDHTRTRGHKWALKMRRERMKKHA